MKTYRVSRPFLWFRSLVKVGLTAAAAFAYIQAISHPTPMVERVALLAALVGFGWVFYVRMPTMPTEIDIAEDGWVRFRGKRGQMRVHVASIRSIGGGLGRRTVQLRHAGGRLLLPNRFQGFYDFLSTVKRLNPAVEIRGF